MKELGIDLHKWLEDYNLDTLLELINGWWLTGELACRDLRPTKTLFTRKATLKIEKQISPLPFWALSTKPMPPSCKPEFLK
jgi:hypothetical protein